MRFFWIEAYLFKDAASFDEVGLSCGFAESMNGYNFILFNVVRWDSDKIISFCLLEFNMRNVCLWLEADSEPLLILFWTLLVKYPLTFVIKCCLFRLGYYRLSLKSQCLWESPNHKLDMLSMGKGNNIGTWPIDA